MYGSDSDPAEGEDDEYLPNGEVETDAACADATDENADANPADIDIS